MLQRCQALSIYNPTTDTEEINSFMWANGQDILGMLRNYFAEIFIECVRNVKTQWCHIVMSIFNHVIYSDSRLKFVTTYSMCPSLHLITGCDDKLQYPQFQLKQWNLIKNKTKKKKPSIKLYLLAKIQTTQRICYIILM